MSQESQNKIYNPLKAEPKWRAVWEKEGLYQTDLGRAQRPFYNLMMFPYPSAEGLHVGHAFAFSGSDIYGRFKAMQGYQVFEPIGFDAFGIHSENFAIKRGEHPRELIQKTTAHYTDQLKKLGNRFNWSRAVDTTKPEYYKWTQWIFLELFKGGLAERKEAPVNWCPDCKTVLADEQVIHGQCERCDSPVEQKNLKQWFLKIATGERPNQERYVESLHKNLATIDWSENVKKLQYEWIGRSQGATIQFSISNFQFSVPVFTTRADTIFGATFLVFSPEKIQQILELGTLELQNQQEVGRYLKAVSKKTKQERTQEEAAGEKTGVKLEGVCAINPATQEKIPVYVADFVIGTYGGGAIMGVPAHDQRDYEFAKKFNLAIRQVIQPANNELRITNKEAAQDTKFEIRDSAYAGEGVLVNSGKFSGLNSQEARKKITQWLKKQGKAEFSVNYKLRDWLISRQRYWGPPIPLVFCKNCQKQVENYKSQTTDHKPGKKSPYSKGELLNPGWVPVALSDLPVELPYIENFQPTGTDKGPLEQAEDWVKVKCPKCGGSARRESDVSDNFLDSAWYFLRYPSTDFSDRAFDKKRTQKWLPVDMYIGGAEHAVLHLMYTRFITMALYDLGHLHFEEPFKKFRAHGHITKDGAKMSKSKGNVVNPDEYIANFGTDVFRMYLMFLGPFTQGGDFRDEGIAGMERFLKRVWNLIQNAKIKSQSDKSKLKEHHHLEQKLHSTIKRVTEDIESLKFNTAIASLMELLNEFQSSRFQVLSSKFAIFIKLLAPFAPHFTESIWREVWGNKSSIHQQTWPEYNEKLLEAEVISLVVQINGRVRDKIELPAGASQDQAIAAAKQSAKIQKWLKNKKIQKTIFVPNKLVNLVLKS